MHSDFLNSGDETLLGLCRPGFEADLAAEHDARRDAFLAEREITVLRIPVSYIDESLESVGEQIRGEIERMLKRRG